MIEYKPLAYRRSTMQRRPLVNRLVCAKPLWLGSLLYLLCCITLAADNFEQGMQALQQGNSQQAIAIWQPLAEAGDVDAQFALGVLYHDALGVEQNHAEANYWFLRAAEQGYAAAQFNLGNAYQKGAGFKPDAKTAVLWWRRAAQQNFGPAQFNLGTALLQGEGTARDPQAGLAWYRRAAANGHPQALSYLDEYNRRVKQARAQSQAATTEIQSEVIAGNETCQRWLENGTGYTIQLMALRDAQTAAMHRQRIQLEPQPIICAYQAPNGLWYGILYGRYNTTAQARRVLADLPAELHSHGPYLRSIDDIRTTLTQVNAP